MKPFLLILAIVFSLNFSGFSQEIFSPGYIINLKGDSIQGEIRIPKKELQLFWKIFFKASGKEKKMYTPDKINEYYLNGYSYIPFEVDQESVFVRKVCSGEIILYEFKYEEQDGNKAIQKSDFFLDKKGLKSPSRITSGKFKKRLSDMVSANDLLVKEIEAKDFKYDGIVPAVIRYNKWVAENASLIQKK